LEELVMPTFTHTSVASGGLTVEFLGISEWRGIRLMDMTKEQLIGTCCEMAEALRQEQERSSRDKEALFNLIKPRQGFPWGALLVAGSIWAAILVRGCS
jgi:hypothetical protein